MKTYTIDGVALAAPRYVVRAGQGWQVRVPSTPSMYFADSYYSGAREALGEAINHLFTCKAERPDRKEQGSKVRVTGHAGLVIVHNPPRGGRAESAQFQIRVPGQPIRTIYIGTRNTYSANYERKLKVALHELQASRRRQGSTQ